MKIELKHYSHMMDEIMKVHTPELEAEYVDKGYGKMRYRWDIARTAKLIPFICDELYPYLDDGHIDTALRNILGHKGV